MPHFPSPGRCIYCPRTDGLTAEHIVPAALGGTWVLDAASCEECRRLTAKFEQIVTRSMYWPLRLRLGIKGRKHKDTPTHWPGILEQDDQISEMPIEVGRFPVMYATITMPPPGIIQGRAPHSGNPELTISMKVDTAELGAFMAAFKLKKFEVEQTLEWDAFAKMIAKIAHAYAVMEAGLEGIEFFLPALILGESQHLGHYVGCILPPEADLQPPTTLALRWREIGDQPYLTVLTTLFGHGRFPTYEAVVGRILEPDVVMSRFAKKARH